MVGLTLLVVLFSLWLIPIPIAYIGYQNYEYNDPEGRPFVDIDPLPVYDFIVVGAGSSGNNGEWRHTFICKCILCLSREILKGQL